MPNPPWTRQQKIAAFWSHVTEVRGDCWIWHGLRHPIGHGRFCGHPAAQFSWELHFGQTIQKGKFACHSCDVPECVHPWHLFEGTNRENQLDKVRKGRQAFGTHHGRTRLSTQTVNAIRRLYATGQWSMPRLAQRFRLGTNHVWRIVRWRVWTRLKRWRKAASVRRKNGQAKVVLGGWL